MIENRKKLDKLFRILSEAEVYVRAMGKIDFDMQCCAPEEGMELAGEDKAMLGKNRHRLTHSKTYVSLLNDLHADGEGLNDIENRTVETLYRDWVKTKNFTPKFAFELDDTMGKAYGAWLTAKKNSDFSAFRDPLNRIAELTRKSIDLRGERIGTYYDACLDDYEPGGSQKQLDAFFARLRERIVPLVRRVCEEGKPIREDFLNRPCPIPEQEAFSKWLLEKEGLRASALVLMTTEHPFTTCFGPKDVRVTTHYYEDNFLSNIFSTLHEGGHALCMQNVPEPYYASHLDEMRITSGMHETISRFYENLIGRSEQFIHFIYPKLKEVSASLMDGVSERELYEGVNIARPSLIRIESDELTYCLHIMVRYEVEKKLVNGDITVDEVPALWNKLYGEYLGIEVPDDARGCLQDVHWTGGFGYFPSYALGNAYGAQILNTMRKDFDVFACVEQGDLVPIAEWLTKNVFSRAPMMDPDEWINAITGESLNPDYYLDYLEEKFISIYGLK